MKVLEKGPQPKWPRKVKCKRCKAKLELALEDVDYDSWKVSGYHFNGTAVSEWKYTFRCPECGHDGNGNEIPESEIPYSHRGRRS